MIRDDGAQADSDLIGDGDHIVRIGFRKMGAAITFPEAEPCFEMNPT